MRRARLPGAPRSRGRAPCGGEPEGRRWQPLAPDEPPRTAGRGGKGQELPSTTLLICAACKHNGAPGIRRHQAIRTALPLQPLCVCRAAVVAKWRLKFLSTLSKDQRLDFRPLRLLQGGLEQQPRRLGAQHGVMGRGRGSLADATGAGVAARGRKGLWNSYPQPCLVALKFLSFHTFLP